MDPNAEVTPSHKDENKPEGENDWFFDIIINFLRSPRWKTPVMSFLDEYCIIFDTEDENKLEYTKIHNDFKNLVEELIGHLLAELGVTQEIFMEACQKAGQNPIHKRIVDQIVAVDNFLAFKKLMQKRNAELNQQAMKLMMKKQKEAADQKQEAELKKQNTEKLIAEQEKTIKQDGGVKDKEMMEAIRIAQEAEQAEEEDFMRRAIEESEALKKKEEEEEAELIKKAIEMSAKEEEARQEASEASETIEPQAKEEPKPEIKVEPPSIVKVEEEKQPEPKAAVTPTPAPYEAPPQKITENPQKLIEITGKPAMSQAELKKFEELKRLQKEAKQAKQKEAREHAKKMGQINVKADSLPPVELKRKGQFELIPDFLKGQTKKDLENLAGLDAMDEAKAKQDALNQEGGPSMAELFRQKAEAAEKAINDTSGKGPHQTEVQERKARLLAQRDKLRQIQDEKRKQELVDFNKKTETKSDLFSELKKIDESVKADFNRAKEDVENQRRLEMFRKARQDVKKENLQENEAAFQKRATELDAKDGKKVATVEDDWLKGMKAHNVDDN